jgi:malate/lactate dehydrogenase
MVGAPGVAADLSHIDTAASATGHGMTPVQIAGDKAIENQSEFQLAAFDAALKDADVVIIPAGVPRKPGMTRQDLFAVNAALNRDFANAVSKNCPNASVAIISNPVNSTVPIFAEQMKKLGAVCSFSRHLSLCFLFLLLFLRVVFLDGPFFSSRDCSVVMLSYLTFACSALWKCCHILRLRV